ncbi:hypothetical protein LTR85_001308 [Meristemomyces frigidus]|nr:hypothetical protein LTR85_001308 [Meristemomyces frigidus]
MPSKADRAIVVVGQVNDRSKSMDEGLMQAIDIHGLRASQVLLSCTAPPRLDSTRLPVIQLAELASPLCGRLRVFHATDRTAAKLLMTPTRDATIAGPALRTAHRNVGWYLATEFVTDIVGLETCTIQQVQSKNTEGHRLLHEAKTTIVALMRGGELMAFGVNDAFPLARLVHARQAADIKLDRDLRGMSTVILVDPVVNSGKTVVDFVRHVHRLHADIRIIVVAGVVQADSVRDKGSLSKGLAGHGEVSLIALRLSENKYTGTGVIDTGNRLFNSTHLL